MRALDPTSVDELVRVYRAHNEPLHDTIEVVRRDRRRPRRADATRAPPRRRHRQAPRDRRARVRPRADRAPVRDRRRRRRDRATQAESRRRCCSRSNAWAPTPAEAAYVGDSPFDMQAAKAAGLYAIGVSWGGIHERRDARPTPTSSSTSAEELLAAPLSRRRARAGAPQPARTAGSHAYHVLDDPVRRRRHLRPPLRRARRARGASTPSSSRPTRRRSASARRRAERFRKVKHLTRDGLAREGDDGRGAREVGRRRPQAARSTRRAGRVRARAEDRRARDQPHLRERRASRAARRAATASQGEDVTVNLRTINVDPAAHARRRRAAAARGARRGVHAALRLPRAERAARRRGQEADAEPAQRRGGLAAPEGLGDHRRAPARRSGPTASARTRALDLDERTGRRSQWLQGARLPHQPVRRARSSRSTRSRRRCRDVGAEARRPRLRDRRHRDQGRRLRAAAATRRAAPAAALGARLQVGADDRDDAAREDHDPRRPHRRAQPVGDAASRSRSAASRSRARRCTTRRTSTARRSARATT